ncbi:MAG TPA: ABC transporter permease [Bryobacteraceae bacterium]|jgi:predicted permease|nr:ABC transporter permease [Bryobacteraceae bacterium]
MLADLRYALRTLRQNPGFALVAIISLALGIGANAAMFSFADALVLRPLPVPDASGLVMVQSQQRGEKIGGFAAYFQMSYPDYVDVRDKSRSFAGLSAAQFTQVGFTAQKGALPQMEFGELVSGNFFRVMEVDVAMGRTFRADEDQVRGRDAVVVLGHDLWKNALSSDPAVVGKIFFLNGLPFTVVGVAPESFLGSNTVIRSALFIPLAMGPTLAGDVKKVWLDQREIRPLTVRGRLKPGVSVAQAGAETAVIGQQLSRAYPDSNRTVVLLASTDQQARLQGNPYNTILVVFLMALAVMVLLIACANVMNLMLSRARARSREIAVRLAIGAGRARLVRQLLTESLVIALLGGALGLVVAEAGVDVFSQIRIPSALPIVLEFRLDPRVLLFSLFAAVASALLFGLAPALRTTNPELVPALKTGKAEGGKRRRFLGRNALVIAQVAISVVLLVFATQAYRGAAIVLSSPVGFRTDHLLIANFDPGLARYAPAQGQDFYKRLLERARGLSGVKSAALAQDVPMGVNGGGARIVPEGVQPGTETVLALSSAVSEGYFETFGIPIIEGRGFIATDRVDSPRVAVVNEQYARKYYPKQSAIGKRFRLNGATGPQIEIVGVAKQSKYAFIVEPTIEFVYLPYVQNPELTTINGMTLLLETAGPPGEMAGPLRDMVRSLDAGQPVFGIRTMEEYFDVRAKKLLNVLLEMMLGMGLLGLALALVGLYGLMTYSVGLRQREIGIRMAIGADASSVLRMVLRQGLVLAAAGVAIGVLLSLLAGKPTTAIIGSAGFDLPLLTLVCFGLLAAAGLGAYIPARRASRLDPNLVLRQE